MSAFMPPPPAVKSCLTCIHCVKHLHPEQGEPSALGCGHHGVGAYYILDVNKPPCRWKHHTPY